MRLQYFCPTCKVQASVRAEFPSLKGGATLMKLSCGHMSHKTHVVKAGLETYQNLVFEDGRRLRNYQAEACAFGEDADLSFLCAHEMGLGKTIIYQALMKVRSEDLYPTAIFCTSGLRRQWLHETIKCQGPIAIQTINTGKDFPLGSPVKVYIVSLDMLRDLDSEPWIGKIKSICIDEIQLLKNHNSKRTQAVRRFVKDTGASVIQLSGSPIENHPGEYFPALNLLRPELFPTQAQFIFDWCSFDTTHYDVKVKKLKSPKKFKEFTQSFITRRTRVEVAPDLPRINNQHRFIDMSKDLMRAYEEVTSEFASFVNLKEAEGKGIDSKTLLGYLNRMRHITGLAKVAAAVDFTTEFLLDTTRKLTIFCYHQDVHKILAASVDDWLKSAGLEPSLNLTAKLDSDEKHEMVQKFWTDSYRVLITPIKVGGTGLNLQVCSDAVIMEPLWNPKTEEQAESRFCRIGSTADKVNITRIIAVGTIDEHFEGIKARKRVSVGEALTGEEQVDWMESDVMRELTEVILRKELKSWSMPK